MVKVKKKRREVWERWDLGKIDWEKVRPIFKPEKKNILDQLRQQGERYPQIRELLYLLAAGAFFSASLIMPGLPRLIGSFSEDWSGYQKKRLSQNLKRLKKQKLVKIYQEGEYQVVKITQKGKARALKYKLEEIKIKMPKHWDRKWHLVIFDIPEKLSSARNFFRRQLKELGFFPLQESVFVYPYPCFKEIEFLRYIFNLGEEDIRYVVAQNIEGEEELKDFFNL
jgi:DNA-binding transcriptional ArsR family regulator